jgi:predicted transcriptional regulator
MSDRLIVTSADWIAVFRERIKELGLTHLDVDARAGLSEGHCGKIMCGMKTPSWPTIEKLCRALDLVAIVSTDGRSSFAADS